MTDLERARAHLLECQKLLGEMRAIKHVLFDVEHWENMFLAALSWVWEEQEKERWRQMIELVRPLTEIDPFLMAMGWE